MTIFTLCSNNYLAMARVLGESVLRHNPGSVFVIGLVDRVNPEIDYRALGPFEIIPVEELGIPEFEQMVARYSIVELNTAVKPFYFRHLFSRPAGSNASQARVVYFDPDVVVYFSLAGIEESLGNASVLLTPHVLSPVPPDGGEYGERVFLNYGVYNLGFCAMRCCEASERLLGWWSAKLVDQCKDRVEEGLFVDQLWMNHAPIFFEQVEVSRNPGFNVAYWNLHERQLRQDGGRWYVNGTTPLVFYHFSSFQMDVADSLGKYSARYSLQNRPEMRPLFDEYRSKLKAYEFARFRKIPCVYVELRSEQITQQRRAYYRKHPVRMIADYWKSPVRLLAAVGKAVIPRGHKPPPPVAGTRNS